MRIWDLRAIHPRPHSPGVLSSSDEARAVVLEIPARESLQDPQVHERAWVSVNDGEVEVTISGENVAGGTGHVVEFAPSERHTVRALRTARPLLLLTPWPLRRASRDDGAQRQGDGQAARPRAPSKPMSTVAGTGSGLRSV